MSCADLDLLQLAAKAAGYEYKYHADDNCVSVSLDGELVRYNWNPLADDADALRLAVDLNIGIDVKQVSKRVTAYLYPHIHCNEGGDDLYAATRRAIVRAAAEIGKSMP